MSKKVFNISGAAFALLAFISLFFPWVSAYCEGELASANMIIRGLNLAEFSVWGTILLILPMITLGIVYSKLQEKTKTILLIGLYLLGSISFYYATSIGIRWLNEVSTGYVRLMFWLLLHPIFLFLSLLSFYLSYNTTGRSLLELIGIAVSDDADEVIGEVYLCSQPYTFAEFKKEDGITPFSGCVSFVTEDGYFAALGQGESNCCLNNECIELFDGDDTAGFVMQTRTSGVYGSFFEDYDCSLDTKMAVMPFRSVEIGRAELWIPGETGFTKIPVEIIPHNPAHITCKLPDSENFGSIIHGAVIVQNGNVAAVISNYDVENNIYHCISASRVVIPLLCMERQQRQLEQETSVSLPQKQLQM